ncbi:MAG TPA: hypothetical protein VMF52_09910 [Steroidobacteraceae bacterium]|nr:hypothetical protein [Steroidobacteraceae bacterium]
MNPKNLLACVIAGILSATLAACVNQQEKSKREMQKFMSYVAGEFVSEDGDTLVIAPVYARMIALDTIYVERTSGNGTSGRLIELAPGKDGKILQLAYGFTQQNQWRNLREQPELFTALLPKDVRAAGTCDIKLSDDKNKVSYSCGGSKPEDYSRVQHGAPN